MCTSLGSARHVANPSALRKSPESQALPTSLSPTLYLPPLSFENEPGVPGTQTDLLLGNCRIPLSLRRTGYCWSLSFSDSVEVPKNIWGYFLKSKGEWTLCVYYHAWLCIKRGDMSLPSAGNACESCMLWRHNYVPCEADLPNNWKTPCISSLLLF